MVEIVRRLRQEHASMAGLLDVLERQIAVFSQGRDPDYDMIEAVVEYCQTYPDLCHHPKEDLVYEALCACDAAAAEAVGDLVAEHRELATLTRRLADAVHDVLQEGSMPRDSLATLARDFIAGYRRHMEMEETLFFPAALGSIGETEWAEIDAQVIDREDPLFGANVEKRFQALRDDILAFGDATSAS